MHFFRTFILLILAFGFHSLQAGNITPEQANTAATHFLTARMEASGITVPSRMVAESNIPVYYQGQLTHYIVNFKEKGFVLLSGTDVVRPVIAYSFETHFLPDQLPEQVGTWMEGYQREIVWHMEQQSRPTVEISTDWKELLSEASTTSYDFGTKDVSPLLPCNWDQGKYYNELCPVDAGGDGGHVYVGCVATSMAMVMFYYRYPNTGLGSHAYNHPSYGLQSVNYGSTTYHWEGMLNQLSGSNNPVALLSYHAAVSVNMDFGPDGSGAQTSSAAASLRNYFRYASNTQFVQKMSYSTQGWIDLLKTNLDQKRPVMYSGYPTTGGAGHCWVCDGYQGADFFHMNWGWSGASNGFYTIGNLNPAAGGTNFNSGNGAVINLYPGSNYPGNCSGQKVITQFTTGTIEDGSGPSQYTGNNNCSWLIAPDDSVNSLKLTFHRFNTEAVNDVVKVYGGATTSAPLLATYSGIATPPVLTHNGSKLLITFETDANNHGDGWYLTYSATYPQYCSSQILTANSGTLTDGSGPKNYRPGTTCTWIIQPAVATGITLTFSAFDTEPIEDYVKIYDLNTEELLATYSGNTIPPPVTSPTGGMFIQFRSNGSNNFQGWDATYVALGTGIDETGSFPSLAFYPNPARDQVYLAFEVLKTGLMTYTMKSADGKVVWSDEKHVIPGAFQTVIDISTFSPGIYYLTLRGDQGILTRKLIKY